MAFYQMRRKATCCEDIRRELPNQFVEAPCFIESLRDSCSCGEDVHQPFIIKSSYKVYRAKKVAKKADDVFSLKENHPDLYNDVKFYFASEQIKQITWDHHLKWWYELPL